MPIPLIFLLGKAAVGVLHHAALAPHAHAAGLHHAAALHAKAAGAHGAGAHHELAQEAQKWLRDYGGKVLKSELKKALLKQLAEEFNLSLDAFEGVEFDGTVNDFLKYLAACVEATATVAKSTGKADRRYKEGKLVHQLREWADMAKTVEDSDDSCVVS